MAQQYEALILGASGLVGQALLTRLLDDPRYHSVTCLVRRPMASHHPKLRPMVVDFERLSEYQGYFHVDHVYVCLGTTMKKAGSKAAFKKVDFELVHIAAQLARAAEVRSFVWVSSVGANSRSRNFYLQTKGRLEQAIFSMLRFENAAAVRPSLLLGQRKESRPLELWGIRLARVLAPLMIGPLKRYRPVAAHEVANKMIQLQRF
ncbi:Oxidoreductase HTATIP2 [Saliniradius amylolyticus]|uniref:Oxidoreductase HTATIP2 n=1 Tax=Saliniradius amylolyticus TaxID=2183582 RepID=A0A2S2E071_9ALTE|nr:NAD(P)H-binding protein [Saliniradius amylolyticus]AWL10999.1 Oxidoreductase HTATIP2 [Saliniradius amylolyticus]